MNEQGTAAVEMARITGSIRQQAEQAARALQEQERAMRDINEATGNTATQIRRITSANREHSKVASDLAEDMAAIRQATDRSAEGVRRTRRSSGELLEHAQVLAAAAKSGNGRKARAAGH